MSYTLDTSHAAKAFTRGRQGSALTTIVVHHWGDPATNPTFDGTVAYFVKGGSNTSAHYVAEAGRVARMVSDSDTAYHAGNWSMNLRSIGIECNPRASDADKATVAELIQNLRRAHGNLPIIGHKDVVSTACPGRYYPPNSVLARWLNSPGSGAGGIVSGGVHVPGAPSFPSTTTTPTQEDDMAIFQHIGGVGLPSYIVNSTGAVVQLNAQHQEVGLALVAGNTSNLNATEFALAQDILRGLHDNKGF
jgi:N-acetylmuramoyl-L-alanine amidase CwlA